MNEARAHGSASSRPRRCEQAGDRTSEEYRGHMAVFLGTFGCRVRPSPEEVGYSLSLSSKNPAVIDSTMTNSAGLADRWEIRDKIPLTRHVPTLLINGEYDYMTDDVVERFFCQ